MHLIDRYLTRDAALIIGANLVPLLGVLLAGWDGFTLLMLYWFESAVIGLWVCIAIAISREPLTFFSNAGQAARTSGIGMALFVLAHAGVFMFVHLMFLIGFREVGGSGFGDAPQAITGLLFGSGLWLPLAGLFIFRGLMTISDHVGGRPLQPTVIGFYLRIIVMQFVILFGGFFVMLLGSSLVPLILLIALRAAIDIGIEPLSAYVANAVEKSKARASAN